MKVTYITDEVNGDWAGLYIDGDLSDQNHSLDVGMVLESLYERGLIDYEHFYVTEEDTWNTLGGQLPETFEEIPEGGLE